MKKWWFLFSIGIIFLINGIWLVGIPMFWVAIYKIHKRNKERRQNETTKG